MTGHWAEVLGDKGHQQSEDLETGLEHVVAGVGALNKGYELPDIGLGRLI